jgi:hypothetical protein
MGYISVLVKRWIFYLVGWDLSPLGTAATNGLLYQSQMIDDGDCGAIGRMKIGKGNLSTQRKPAQHHFVHHKSHMTSLQPGSLPCNSSVTQVGGSRVKLLAMAAAYRRS